MTEISGKTRENIQVLAIIAKGSKLEQGTVKTRRARTAETLLKAGSIPHSQACYKCGVDCEVNRQKDVEFWGNKEGPETPPYTRMNCPRDRENRIRGKMREKEGGQ